MDENKHPQQPQTSKESEKGHQTPVNKAVPKTANRRIFAKRWVYPAIYLGAAALIIGLMYIKSQSGSSPVMGNAVDDTGKSAPTATEKFVWPAASGTKVTMGFFNEKGTEQQQEAALVFYDNTYIPHLGYDIAAPDKKPFNVVSATDGKVTDVKQNPVYGLTVEVTTDSGYVIHYASLGNASVKAGDKVTQGQTIGTSGTCEFEKAQGNHLYFEVLKNGNPVDPGTLLPSQQ
jgi:stage II sporulation protein Q